MNHLGVQYNINNIPKLDPDFVPYGVWMNAYLEGAEHPFSVAVEREDGKVSVFESALRGEDFAEANQVFVDRLVKFLLWSVGGFRVYLCGCDKQAEELKKAYAEGGARIFDKNFMQDVYECPFEIIITDKEHLPAANEATLAVGGHLEGCRIGFDAGGSDRKVSAVIDGKTVYSEEVVWFPKLQEDPNYHYEHILEAFRTAASKMPRVDAIGVSSAGVFVGNCPKVASLFIKVPRERREEVKSIYERAAAAIGDVPLAVANDGDVTALAGSMSLGSGEVMGLAMGTSEAVGYVAGDGNVLGWFNELAFAPVDVSDKAMQDEWSTDFGVGCKYFSQDAVIKLAPRVGIQLDEAMTPAEKLTVVQELMEKDDPRAQAIYTDIGRYLAYTVSLYSRFYDIQRMMVLGRVMSGTGGDTILAECQRVLKDEFPKLYETIQVMLPDENTRRVGQSVAAASLPELMK